MKIVLIKIVKVLLRLLYVFPVNKNKITVCCFGGHVYGFDGKAFIDWCHKNRKEFKFIYISDKTLLKHKPVENNVKFVRERTIRSILHLATSGVVFCNINPPFYIPYRKSQIIINTWHGFGFKKAGKTQDTFIQEQFNLANAFTSHAKTYSELVINDLFNYYGDIIKCGAPRNDIFFTKEKETIAKKVKKEYGVENKNVVIYSPTFRGNFEYKDTALDIEKIVKALSKRFGGEWVFFMRLHPMIAKEYSFNDKRIIDVSKHQDMQELLCAADAMISDYSGCIWDFSLNDRPIFIYADDIEEYSKTRGLYFDLKKIPYPISHNDKELLKDIAEFDEKDYMKKLTKFRKEVETYENGNASETIIKYIDDKRKKANK